MAVLGLSANEADCAAALAQDGVVVAAVDERRFGGRPPFVFPQAALDWCLGQAGLGPADIDRVVIAEARLHPLGLAALWTRPARRQNIERWLTARGLGGKALFVPRGLPVPGPAAILGVEPAAAALSAALFGPAPPRPAPPRPVPAPPAAPGAAAINAWLDQAGAYAPVLDEMSLVYASAEYLSLRMTVAWFEGPPEPGLRPIGARAILADPRQADMIAGLGAQIRRPPAFGALAAVIPADAVGEWFEFVAPGADGLDIGRVRDPARMPAVSGEGGLARVRRIEADRLPRLDATLRRFHDIAGCPVLAAEALALTGEPVARGHEAAFRVFMGSGVDVLTIGGCFIRKQLQDQALKLDDFRDFALD